MPNASAADTVILKPTPFVTLVGPLTMKCVTAPGATETDRLVATDGCAVSATESDCVPAVFSVTVKV